MQHIAANLCLSDSFDAVIHDWADIEPLYRKKFTTSVRLQDQVKQEKQEHCKRLFEVMCPEFQPSSAEQLAEILSDRRIDSLRKLIDDAVAGSVVFDEDFAQQTLWEVLKIEGELNRTKNIIGWVTKPLSLVPWAGSVLDTVTEKVVSKLVEQRKRRGKEWFYLLSDIRNQFPERGFEPDDPYNDLR